MHVSVRLFLFRKSANFPMSFLWMDVTLYDEEAR